MGFVLYIPARCVTGFPIGPEVAPIIFIDQVAKVERRVKEISRAGLSPGAGFQLANALAVPVLGYVAQLYRVAQRLAEVHRKAAQRLSHVMEWGISALAFRHLRRFGLPVFDPLGVTVHGAFLAHAMTVEGIARRLKDELRASITISEDRPLWTIPYRAADLPTLDGTRGRSVKSS